MQKLIRIQAQRYRLLNKKATTITKVFWYAYKVKPGFKKSLKILHY